MSEGRSIPGGASTLAEEAAAPTAALPEGIALTPLEPAFRRDPHPILRRLREIAPIHRDTQLPRIVLTRYRDVKRILDDRSYAVDPRKARPDSYHALVFGEARRAGDAELSMLLLDDPEHRRLRALVWKDFTPRAVEAHRPLVRDVARRLAAQIADAEFDLMDRFANELPTVVIAELLGVERERQADFKHWSETCVVTSFNPFSSETQRQAAQRAGEALDAYFVEQIERRRRRPGSDLISRMVLAGREDDRLRDDEIVRQCNLLLLAGNLTTTDLIGNGVKALLESPDGQARLRGRPELIPNAVEEMLRFDPPVTNTARIAPRDGEIDGHPLRAGETVMLMLAAANRDPEIHADPDRFDVGRRDPHHLAFGGGTHICLGAHLARLEAQEALAALLARFPRLSLSPRGHVHREVPAFRGLASLWLTAEG